MHMGMRVHMGMHMDMGMRMHMGMCVHMGMRSFWLHSCSCAFEVQLLAAASPAEKVQAPRLLRRCETLRHHAGEAAVGASAGAVVAWLLHRLQRKKKKLLQTTAIM